MTPADLKKIITSAISEQIGEYEYSNGHKSQAIAVGNVPNDVKVMGLEVIIPNFPDVPKSNQCGDTYIHREERWQIELILHGSDRALFYTAIDRLLRCLPRAEGRDIPQNSPLNTLPRYLITFRHSDGYERI